MICPHCINWGHSVEVFSSGWLFRCLRCCRDIERKIVRVPIKLERRGKVIICCVHNRTIMNGVDIQLFAVGKPKGETYFKWWQHCPALAPTRDLVTFTKMHNREKGKINGWFERYTESLIEEWDNSKEFQKEFKQLLQWLKEGKVVAIACYCHPMKRDICHLSILADLIRDFNYEVEEAQLIDLEV